MRTALYNRDDFQKAFTKWWSGLSGQPEDGSGEERGPDRGSRAELRRAKSALQVCMTEAFGVGFLGALQSKGIRPSSEEIEALAKLAGLAAHVKMFRENASMGSIMARPRRDGSRAAVSPIRFRKFLTIDDPDELYIALVRVLRMTDQHAHLASLARACFSWNNETRRWWALEYYNALPNNESEH